MSVDAFVSVGETRMLGYLEYEREPLVRYAARHFVKSYPKGLRTDSSNMYPVPQWAAGIQIGSLLLPTFGGLWMRRAICSDDEHADGGGGHGPQPGLV